LERLLTSSRLARRSLCLDKCNVIPVENGFMAIRQGKDFQQQVKKLGIINFDQNIIFKK